MTTEDIDKTIKNLCCELRPVRCFNPLWRGLLWFLMVVSYTSAVAMTIGFRHNINEMMGRQDFVFELSIAFGIAISSAFMAFWLSIPDCNRHRRLMAVPLTLLAVQLYWVLERTYFEGIGDFRENWLSHCWMNAVIYVALPALAVILLVRKGATVMPYWLATFAVMAVSEFGWIGISLVCPHDNVGEAYILHFLPYVVMGILAGFVGKKLFRW